MLFRSRDIKFTFGVKLKTLSTSGLGQILLLPATASAIYPTGDVIVFVQLFLNVIR